MNIAHISSFPPNRCGIGILMSHLIQMWMKLYQQDYHDIWVVDEGALLWEYTSEISGRIEADSPNTYIFAAESMNERLVDVVDLQHEYRLFGDQDGDYILLCLERLIIPVCTTLHMVFDKPTRYQVKVTQEIAKLSNTLIVHTEHARALLSSNIYNVQKEKIHYIPLPVYGPVIKSNRSDIKHRLGLDNNLVLVTAGLLRQDKGIEFVLQALPQVIEKYQQVRYLIVGETHPGVRRREGEKYRNKLKELIDSLYLNNFVLFIDKFLSEVELSQILTAADIYLAPYQSNQIASSTVAMALLHGRVVIAQPFPYAKEVLSNKTGITIDFSDPFVVANTILHILEEPQVLKTLERNAQMLASRLSLSQVIRDYKRVFTHILTDDKLRHK